MGVKFPVIVKPYGELSTEISNADVLIVATSAFVIKASGVIFFLSPVYTSFKDVLKFSISVTSASS